MHYAQNVKGHVTSYTCILSKIFLGKDVLECSLSKYYTFIILISCCFIFKSLRKSDVDKS